MTSNPDRSTLEPVAWTPAGGPAQPVVELHCVVKHFIHRAPEPSGGAVPSDQRSAGRSSTGEVRCLSLMILRGEILVLLGPSGCGKTTTLRLIAGFEQPDSGTVWVEGKRVANRQHSVPPEQRGLGMVFQDYALFPHLTVTGNTAFGLHGLSRRRRRERVQEVLDLVGLTALGDRYPHALSGGQQQRVALARALAPWPSVVLFDEPFSNLDADLRQQMRDDVRRILKESGSTALFVTHDQQEALMLGDRVAVMRRGFVEQVDTPERIFHLPHNRFVADFLGEADFLPATVTGNGLQTEIGMLPAAYAMEAGQELEVMLRPHDLQALPATPGHGTVIGADFAGDCWRYRIRLHSGQAVRCLMPHTTSYPLGTAVQVVLAAEHGLICFRGDRSLQQSSM